MAEIIDIQAIPSQTVSATLGGERYDITLKSTGSIVAADVSRDGVTIITGQRVVAESPIIPYSYLETGNFLILTEDSDPPDYTKFGDSQVLYFASSSDLELIRG